MAQWPTERPVDPMSLSSILNAEPPSNALGTRSYQPKQLDEMSISLNVSETPTSTTRPLTPDSEQTLDSVSSVWSSHSPSEEEVTSSHSMLGYRAREEGTFTSFSVPKRQATSSMETKGRSGSTSHSRAKRVAVEGDFSSYRSPPTRAPRPKYTEEQPYFIWYHRTDLREPWGVVVEKYRKEFGELRQKGGLQCKFYRLLEEWRVPKVREQTRQSTDRIGAYGVAERTPQSLRAKFSWMSRAHRQQPMSIECEHMPNPVTFNSSGFES